MILTKAMCDTDIAVYVAFNVKNIRITAKIACKIHAEAIKKFLTATIVIS